ncbi:MAG: pyridoxamine 5'-phosphate oxidase family protein [Burkholderiaceae bacterium]
MPTSLPPVLPADLPAGLPDDVADYLDRHHVMTLATCGADGPWAAAVFYCNAGRTLYFVSSPSSRHGRDLARDPRCAATIQDDTGEWATIKGVQVEGQVLEIGGDEALLARQKYGEKFPVVGRLASAPAVIVQALAKVRWYRLRAQRLYFIDNSKGFGHRHEIELSP